MRSSFFFLGLAIFTFKVMAAEDYLIAGGRRSIFSESPTKGTFEERAIGFTETVANRVSATGQAIDMLLARKKYTERRNESHVNISQLLNWSEGGNFRPSTDFGFNLALPNVEKRWQLRFSSYDEEQDSRDLTQRSIRTTARPRDPGAALVFFKKLGSIKTSFQPRLQLKSPLQVAYVVRLESAAQSKSVRIEPRVEFFADSLKGTGEFAAIRLITKFAEKSKWQFALENDEEYREKSNSFATHHGVTAGYALSDTEGLSASAVATSENHDFHLSALNLGCSYGKEIYADLLKYGVTPYLGFGKADAFHGHPGLTLALEVIF